MVVLAALLAAVLPAAPVAAGDAGARLAVYPSGPIEQVTRDLAYAAFPFTVRSDDGYVLAHGLSTSHYGPTGRVIVRRSTDGIEWGNGGQLPGQTAGYSWGPAGLAAETAEQGGRVYLAVVREGWIPNSQTVNSVAGFMRWSDDGGRTWADGVPFPGAGSSSAFTFFPNDITVLADGTLLASGYSFDRHARYLASSDRGLTWAPAGDVAVAGRKTEEPTLCPLPDGRVLSLLRSDDATGGGGRLYATIRTGTAWSAPYVITYDGSGRPDCTLINDSTVMVPYRGWIDRADDSRRPMRAQLLGLQPDGRWVGYRGNIEVTPGWYGRWLYGEVIATADGWRAIVGIEGPNGPTAPSAQIVSIPLGFREAP